MFVSCNSLTISYMYVKDTGPDFVIFQFVLL